ncbi:MAG: hypothetical protein M3R35_00780 [Candidatus Eremiobacteraeota bacterium]|nr:hypothetical protein [Candidatus Eremiobacteraeota bacterium]
MATRGGEAAAVITVVAQNFGIVLFVIAIVVAAVKLRRARTGRRVTSWPYVFWGEILFYAVGLGMVYAGAYHAFAQSMASKSIGWVPSPFEWELAWAEFGTAVIAIAALWRGFEMRLAATIVFVIFSFGAAFQHVNQIRCCHNYAPGNAGPILWFGDIVLPLIVLVLAVFSRDAYERNVRW